MRFDNFWRRKTGGRHLWFRNNASTMVSQAIDTAIFITIAFWGTAPGSVFVGMLVGQHILKVIISVVDTPFVYAPVGLIRKYGDKLEGGDTPSFPMMPATGEAGLSRFGKSKM